MSTPDEQPVPPWAPPAAPGSMPPGPYLADEGWNGPMAPGSPPPGPYLSDSPHTATPSNPAAYGAPPPGPYVSDSGTSNPPPGPRTEYHEPLLTRLFRRFRGGA